MEKRDMFRGLFGDDFVRDFSETRESDTRECVATIGIALDMLRNNLSEEQMNGVCGRALDDILFMCRQLLKNSEIYSRLMDICSDAQVYIDTISMPKLLDELLPKCTLLLRDKCKVAAGDVAEELAKLNITFLKFSMMATIRHLVINGAKELVVSYNLENDYAVLTFCISSRTKVNRFYLDDSDFFVKYGRDLIEAMTERMNGTVEFTDDRVIFRYPQNIESVLELRCPRIKITPDSMDVYHLFLTDLGRY